MTAVPYAMTSVILCHFRSQRERERLLVSYWFDLLTILARCVHCLSLRCGRLTPVEKTRQKKSEVRRGEVKKKNV